MADLLQTGAAWLTAQMQQFASQPIVYVRGNQSIPLSATIGRTEFEEADAYGVVQQVVSRDYLFPATALVPLAGLNRPQRGDEVQETRDGVLYRYQVIAPQGEPHWRYSDAYQQVLRVHTKLISEDAA